MMQKLDRLVETASQTAGPYVHIGCTPTHCGIDIYGGGLGGDLGAAMKTGPVQGQEITIRGKVFDGMGAALKDALIEIWQADANGVFPGFGLADPNFKGWGRAPGDDDSGEFVFDTVKPGRVAWPDGRIQAPHISVWLVARGINIGLQTRIYFDDEAEANAQDPILTRIEHRARIPTLLARATAEGQYRFDIHIQGPQETVFFDI